MNDVLLAIEVTRHYVASILQIETVFGVWH